MRISRTALAATVLAGITAVGFGVSIGTASAEDVSGRLDIRSFGDIAVDSAHKRVFISDPANGRIIATTYRGEEIDRVQMLPGVRGLTLSADSNTLHAAVPRANAIVSLSATTLDETARYQLGSTVFPADRGVRPVLPRRVAGRAEPAPAGHGGLAVGAGDLPVAPGARGRAARPPDRAHRPRGHDAAMIGARRGRPRGAVVTHGRTPGVGGDGADRRAYAGSSVRT